MTQLDIVTLIKALVYSIIISLVIVTVINVFTKKFLKKTKSNLNLNKIYETDFELTRYSQSTQSSISLVFLTS